MRKSEVDCATLAPVAAAVGAGADIIMLDNMDAYTMRAAVDLIDHRCETECSGNIDVDGLARIAGVGVDYVSSGALTHSAGILDLSMKHLKVVE